MFLLIFILPLLTSSSGFHSFNLRHIRHVKGQSHTENVLPKPDTFSNDGLPEPDEDEQMDSIRSILKNIVNDWDDEDGQSSELKRNSEKLTSPERELQEIQKDISQEKNRKEKKNNLIQRKQKKHRHKHIKTTITQTLNTKDLQYLFGTTDKQYKVVKPILPHQVDVSSVLKDRSLWIGIATGTITVVVIMLFGVLIFLLVRKLSKREKCIDLKNLSLCDVGGRKMNDPVYIRLSQLHDPRKGPQYVVSVLDKSNNFSVNSNSSSSSEEEIFNVSDVKSENDSFSKQPRINMTSTPIKSPLRLNSRRHLSKSTKKSLSFSAGNSPVSPLAMTPPFSSPVKKYKKR